MILLLPFITLLAGFGLGWIHGLWVGERNVYREWTASIRKRLDR